MNGEAEPAPLGDTGGRLRLLLPRLRLLLLLRLVGEVPLLVGEVPLLVGVGGCYC